MLSEFLAFVNTVLGSTRPDDGLQLEDVHVRGDVFPQAYNGVDLDKECGDMIDASDDPLRTKNAWVFIGVYARDVMGEPCLTDRMLEKLIGEVVETQTEEGNSLKILLNSDTTNPETYGRDLVQAATQLLGTYK